MKIKIAGLGPGSIDNISFRAYKLLTSDEKIYIRTKDHPVIKELEDMGMKGTYLDYFYEENSSFEKVYENIATFLIEKAKSENEIVYAVPGHPYVAESTVTILEQMAKDEGIDVEVYPSMSFIDAMFAAVKRDPSNGFELMDAFTLDEDNIEVNKDLVITQVYDDMTASDIKLKLMEVYDDEQEILLVKNAGIKETQLVKSVKLYEMDRNLWDYDHLTSIYIKSVNEKKFSSLKDLIEIVRTLRGENGCPWDKKQTHLSLKDHIVEEATEVKEAIENDDIDNLIEELGDVLLHIVFHSELGREDGYFNLRDVTDGISKKLIRRHPHVFSDLEIDENDLPKMWENLKKMEKINKNIEK